MTKYHILFLNWYIKLLTWVLLLVEQEYLE